MPYGVIGNTSAFGAEFTGSSPVGVTKKYKVYMFKGFNKFNAKKSGSYDSKLEILIEDKFGLFVKAGLISCMRRCHFHFLIIPEISYIEEYDKEYVTPKKGVKKVKHIVKKVTDEKAAHYTPDFLYYDNETSEYVMLEVKSYITKKQQDYNLRRKLMKHIINEHNAKGRGQWRFEEIEI